MPNTMSSVPMAKKAQGTKQKMFTGTSQHRSAEQAGQLLSGNGSAQVHVPMCALVVLCELDLLNCFLTQPISSSSNSHFKTEGRGKHSLCLK